MHKTLQATHRLRQSIAQVAATLTTSSSDRPVGPALETLLEAARQATAIMDYMTQVKPDLTVTVGPDGTITSISEGVIATLGYAPDEITAGDYRRLVDPQDSASMRTALHAAIAGKTITGLQARFRHRDGETIWLEWTMTPLEDGAGAYALARDITTHKQYERLLRESEHLYQALFDFSPDGVFTLDREGNVVTANPACTAITGYEPEELLGAPLGEYICPDCLDQTLASFQSALNGEAQNMETAFVHKDGRRVALHVTTVPLILDDSVMGVYGVARDITERKQAEEQLAHLAFHDPLTELANRNLFMNRLDQAATGNVENQPSLAILYLDLDDFKIVNDSLGHRAGDALLIETAHRLRACVGPRDTVARLGGDEFTLLLADTTDTDDAIRVAERLLNELQAPYFIDGHKVVVTPSIGVVMGNQGKDAKELLRYADIAMYKAKRNGKARYEAFTPVMYNQVLQRLQLESDLRRAIERGEFRAVYQPIVDLTTGDICGAEALIRWEDPVRGTVNPMEFIPIAEETGLILPISRWILDAACRQARRWQEHYPDLFVSVNLSARHFHEPFLADEIARVLKETQLDPRGLQLEITETALMQEGAATQDCLQQLKALGIRIAMDDFGTGYSSLSYLKQFPIDVLKIDRSFVQGLGKGPRDAALVRTVIQLAKALNLKVTGEGIETAEQLSQLKAMDCECGQGFYFARPLAAHAVADLLAARAAG